MKKIIFILIISIIITPVFAQEVSYCDDKESWEEWNELVSKYPHNMDTQMLHAIRIGFCKKIQDGTISFEAARGIFNTLHETVIKKAKKEQKQMLKNKQL